VTIRNGDTTKTFTARPTKQAGVYRASVTFPSAGTWTYVVNDGFVANQAHSFPPVDIGANTGAPAAERSADDGSPTWLAFPGIALMAGALALLLVRDRRRHSPGHQPQAA
jgi:hypothetical protein